MKDNDPAFMKLAEDYATARTQHEAERVQRAFPWLFAGEEK